MMSTTLVVLVVISVALVASGGGYAWGRASVRSARGAAADRTLAPTASVPSVVPAGASTDEPVSGMTEVVDERLLEHLREAVDQIEQGVVLRDQSGVDLFRNRVARRYTEARDGLVLVEAALGELLEEAMTGRTVRRDVELFGPPAQSFVITALPFAGTAGVGGLAIVEDRSLQRRTETVRRDFVANISHELKTPIGALGLLAETIRDEPDSEVVERLAERMILEADRAGSTVDDLLELSRIEFGDETEFDDISVQSIVSEAVGRIAAAADHAQIGVVVELSPDIRVVGDRRQLVSALFNLLDNAVKYSPSGSEVHVRAALDPDRDLVDLSVEDAGIGIPRRDLDRVFERFYRVDRARSRVTGGTGLGLAIVRHVASNHGGHVSVESTEGVGTTFTLTLAAVPRPRSVRAGATDSPVLEPPLGTVPPATVQSATDPSATPDPASMDPTPSRDQ